MIDKLDSLESQMQHWRTLPAGDRKAILRRLPPERRLDFSRLTSLIEEEVQQGATRGKRFHGYSPWLARIIQASETGTVQDVPLKAPAMDALLQWHRSSMEQEDDSAASQSVTELFGSLFRHVRSVL